MHRRPPVLEDSALAELAEGEERLDPLVGALEPTPVAPSASARTRLLDALARTHRFDDLEAQVARLLDIDPPSAARMLLDVDEARVWGDGPDPSCRLFHVEGGPRVADAVTGFVRIAPGGRFPQHEHLGDETVLVLQGAFRERDGTIVGAGQIATMPAGSAHAFTAEGDLPLLYLAVVQKGVVIDGTPLLAGDPRA